MRLTIFLVSILLISSFANPKGSLRVYKDFNSFEPLLHQKNDTTYVINFWATWCKPCVEELPFFDTLAAHYSNQKLKVILVSMDFSDQIASRVEPFIKSKNVKSEVVVFDAPNPNDWIPKIDKNWSGAIPATYIYNGKKKAFYEQPFEYEELQNAVEPYLK